MEKTKQSWADFYKDRVGAGYTRYAEGRYKPFIETIAQYTLPHMSLREEGSGIGTISKIISNYMSKINCLCMMSMFDVEDSMRKLAITNVRKDGEYDSSNIVEIYCDDIRTHVGSKVDIIFSHGVLEHFDEFEMKLIVGRQKQEANKVIHYVPTNKYNEPSFGDERLEPIDWWVVNLRPDTFFTFNGGKDLVLVWNGSK